VPYTTQRRFGQATPNRAWSKPRSSGRRPARGSSRGGTVMPLSLIYQLVLFVHPVRSRNTGSRAPALVVVVESPPRRPWSTVVPAASGVTGAGRLS